MDGKTIDKILATPLTEAEKADSNEAGGPQ
jgi:hypothetical protein